VIGSDRIIGRENVRKLGGGNAKERLYRLDIDAEPFADGLIADAIVD
jgi:hypothetical protein